MLVTRDARQGCHYDWDAAADVTVLQKTKRETEMENAAIYPGK